MLLNIKHHTSYVYDRKVFLEPHHLYFRPLQRNYLTVKGFDLKVSPSPSGSSTRIDIENNPYEQCWFNSETDHLDIHLELSVETKKFNQFNYFVEETAKTKYQSAINLYLQDQVSLEDDMIHWIEQFDRSNRTSFLSSLCNLIHERWDHSTSYKSKLLDPNACFRSDSGSCRDLSWMMIQILRYEGYPARFVSGYSHNPEIDGHELHAWVETWLPGAGWIGLDPSSGLFTTEFYVPIAASYHPVNTLPVQGTYRGAVNSKLDTWVEITTIK
ncbi:MAG: transglutaminase family protein [Bacteroidota bacterium]